MGLKRLLYLQNGKSKQTIARLDERFESWGLQVERYWAWQNEFPDDLHGYDGIFLSGSPHGAYEDIPFIHREHALIKEAAALNIPMLGICFGSQILASALCGKDQVFRRETCEIGNKWLQATAAAANDSIAAGILPQVYMFVWHNDEVRATHPDMTILAASDQCPNQIWRYKDRPIWGIQGHPEITLEQAPLWFEQNRTTMGRDGADIQHLIATADEALAAKSMLTRFVTFISR